MIALPERNEETYRWRGDLGVLDRVSYQSRDKIPRNWKETSIDPVRITSLRIELPETNLLKNQEKIQRGTFVTNMSVSSAAPFYHDVQRDERPNGNDIAPPKKRCV